MGYIASVFASRALALAATRGEGDRHESAADGWLDSARIQRSQLDEPEALIDDHRFFTLLEAIAKSSSEGRYIGIRVGSTMRCDDYGAFGLAFKSSVDLRGSFQRVERYGRVVTNVANFTVTRGGNTTWLTVPAARSGRPGEDITNELALAAATALSREVGGGAFAAKRVSFLHAPPGDRGPMEECFGCPVIYAGDRNGLELDNRTLQTTNALGDAKISEFFDRHLEGELRERKLEDSLEERVMKLITPALSEGPPRIEDVARRLGMSRRTLQRRLAEQDVAYLELIDQARRELASSLLRGPRYGLAEIAFLTGYADQSTFTRAFRRGEGLTPADYRRAAIQG